MADPDLARPVFDSIVEEDGLDELPADAELFDRVDADILTNFLGDLDETFFGDRGTDTRWDGVYAGTMTTVFETLMRQWDGTTLVGVEDGQWVPPWERM